MLKLLFHAAVAVLMVATWLDRTLRPALRFPRDPKQLGQRQAWCINTLTDAGLVPIGSQVSAFAVVPFKTDAAFRSLCASLDIDVVARDGQKQHLALLAKFAPPANNLRDHAIFILQDNHRKEVGVYRHLGTDPHIALPKAYFAETQGAAGNLCLLLERMQGAVEVSERAGCPVELCDVAVDALATLHAAFWERNDDPRTAFLPLIPDQVIDFMATLFQGPDRALFAQLLQSVWRHDKQAPTTVLHGDARVGNMLFAPTDGTGRFVLVDWQAARKGKGVFDLAYFLVLSVEPTVRRAHAERLLDRYHAALLAGGVQGYSRQTLRDDYHFSCLLTLAFVSLPLLSAESSATAANAAGLSDLGEVWTRRMAALVDDFDFAWIQTHTGLDAGDVRAAFARTQVPQLAE